MPNDENQSGFVRRTLPWIAGAAALVVFLTTLNQWVSLRSLPVAAKVAGWDWAPPLSSPLFYLLTLPLRFLPAGILPVALNVFSALCGALTVILLARSVALLPHDRTHEQRQRERSEFSLLSIRLAWLPPVLASFACAFQLTFWEHSTAVTGEILDVLIFAYVIRCLLEFRVSQRDSWLSKMALVYGLGVTNNWAMIGFFPFFLGAVVWVKGLRFFDPSFLVRMVVFGLSGLLLYLFLPALWVSSGQSDYGFFAVLRGVWSGQKQFLVDTPQLRSRALLLSLTSILPVILMGIRWPSSFGDTSVAGASLTNLAFRLIHLFFLAAGLWVAFDPKYSPRELGLGVSFLSFYYLGALAIGYYSGYALLVFTEPPRKSWRRENPLSKLVNPVVQVSVFLACLAVPVALVYKNYTAIRANNGTLLREFTARTAETLPSQAAYLLSEDPYQLALLQAHLDAAGTEKNFVLINARTLESPAYHQQLRKQYGERWPAILPPEEVPDRIAHTDIQRLISGLVASNSVIYLHPSFGYFFERIYPEPQGQTYLLRAFEAAQVLPPALTAAQVEANRAFWAKPAEYLEQIEKLSGHQSPDATYVAQYYSRALNRWGVDLQRQGQLAEAGGLFARALRLNTNNVPARLNQEFNQVFQAGGRYERPKGQKIEDLLGTYRSWDSMLSENGPFDHPEFCRMLGQTFLSQQQFRQAALQASRVVQFEPESAAARIELARTLVLGNWVTAGLAEIDKIVVDFPNLDARDSVDLISLRSIAYFAASDFTRAEQVLLQGRAQYPDQGALAGSLFELYRAAGQYTNALAVVDQQLSKTPTNIVILLQKAEMQISREDFKSGHSTLDQILAIAPNNPPALLFQTFAYLQQKNFEAGLAAVQKVLQQSPDHAQALLYKGIIHMEQKQFDRARESFNAVLEEEPENLTALRNRAVLNLRAQRWTDAQEDYERLRKRIPTSHAVMYGLAEIAYNEGDRAEAARHYEAYLKYAPEGTAELESEKAKVQERLKELKAAPK